MNRMLTYGTELHTKTSNTYIHTYIITERNITNITKSEIGDDFISVRTI